MPSQTTRRWKLRLQDCIGKKFNRLTVLRFVESRRKPSGGCYPIWECQCDCGKIFRASSDNIKNGRTTSCGCYKKEVITVHGCSGGHPIYKVWKGMLSRCNNPNHEAWKRYGGRGIIVCDEWRYSFLSFLEWAMRHGYRNGFTLERRNNDGHYSPSNCIWATRKEQSRNTRTNRLLDFNGQKMPLSAWAEKLGLRVGCLHHRLSRGWSLERALTTPCLR